MEPTISKDEIIYYNTDVVVQKGEIVYVVLKNLENKVGRYYPLSDDTEFYYDSQYVVTSDNSNYEPLIVKDSEIESMAKVISVTSTRQL